MCSPKPEKLQDEIDGAFERENSEGTMLEYSSMQGLRYMDMVIKETLRKYPPTGVLTRACTKVRLITNNEVKKSSQSLH